MVAAIAAIERIIGDQHFHVGGAGQRLKLLADYPGTQQQNESAPIGMDRVEKPIHRVLGHAAASICFECAVQVLSGKDQGEQNQMVNFRLTFPQKECCVIEGHLLPNHVHMLISIPPKYAVSQVIGYMKGKSAIHITQTYMGRKKNFTGQNFWARGYFVSTVGTDEKTIREYIRRQEQEDHRLDQLSMFGEEPPSGGQ